jgi:hypothetical protein
VLLHEAVCIDLEHNDCCFHRPNRLNETPGCGLPFPVHEAILQNVARWFRELVDYTAETMKNAFFWDVTACGSFKNGSFGGT